MCLKSWPLSAREAKVGFALMQNYLLFRVTVGVAETIIRSLLCCGYCSVSFQSFVLRHLVVAPVPNIKALPLFIKRLIYWYRVDHKLQAKKTNFTCKELTFCSWTIAFIIIPRYFRGIAPFTLGIGKNPSLRILKGPTGDRTHKDFERSISSCSYISVSPNEKKLNPMNNHMTDLQRAY